MGGGGGGCGIPGTKATVLCNSKSLYGDPI